jgi:hypothetical protein
MVLGQPRDAVLVNALKQVRPTKFEVGMPSDEDYDNTEFCQKNR